MTEPWQIHVGDSIDVLATLEPASVDAIVTDPPYGLGFMGKAWDELPPGEEMAAALLRVAKPGAHVVAFGGTRTYHRLVCAFEDAGWQIRDQLAWVYGSGFPKSLDVSKAIDKKRDDSEDVLAVCRWIRSARDRAELSNRAIDEAFGFAGMAGHWTSAASQPAVPTWEQWERLKTLLGPAAQDAPDGEVWRLNGRKGEPGEAWGAREVLGTAKGKDASAGDLFRPGSGNYIPNEYEITAPATEAARQWDGWGTALKPAWEPIMLARKPLGGTVAANVLEHGTGALNVDGCRVGSEARVNGPTGRHTEHLNGLKATATVGRWPANLIHDGSDEATAGMRDAARYFYTAKASSSERNAGLEGMRLGERVLNSGSGGRTQVNGKWVETHSEPRERENHHPTVKPLALMAWLCRLITPPGGLILDPFLGSGSTMVAALRGGFRCVGIERQSEYAAIAQRRVEEDMPLFSRPTG